MRNDSEVDFIKNAVFPSNQKNQILERVCQPLHNDQPIAPNSTNIYSFEFYTEKLKIFSLKYYA
jgi:hypothetical protein